MFDDDDDVEPQIKVVDKYYCEHSEDNPVCFSILPLHFDNNEEVVECDSEKKVYLRGVLDNTLCPVHKRVVAWRVALDCEQPKIIVLSSEGNWITLLSPRKCYQEKIVRSVLITVQMLHFIKKQPGDKKRLWDRLWNHLYEVFDKLDSKPTVDDLRKHHPVIKLFVERDTALIKSKILQRFIQDTTGKIKEPETLSTKTQLIVSGDSRLRIKDVDGDQDDKNDCDYSYSEHNSDNEYNLTESSSEDDYRNSENNSNDDDSSDDGNVDDGCTDADAICAICDDGGRLLSCTGQCKRSFHPRLKDGIASKCRTLGYTSAQLKGLRNFLCQNCKYKQHQCFKCGELEPSDELNAKVFKCNKTSCGHFYHPKCVAKLLEPADGDGACELAKRIMSGMSFTCPVHWCFKCVKMEDRTQTALQFAVCRRCPKSYHRECLPRNISFESKDNRIKQRAWELPTFILIYCRDHRIYGATGTVGKNHIRFPRIPEASKPSYLVEKKQKPSGKGKMSVDRCSTKSAELLNRLCTGEIEHNQRLTAINPYHPVDCSKEDQQFEVSAVGSDASPGNQEAVRQPENRVTSERNKEISSGTSHDIARKCVVPSTLGICGYTVQDIVADNPLVDMDAGWDRISGDKDGIERDKASERYEGEERDASNKDSSHENHKRNGVLNNFSVEKNEDGSELKSRKERGMEQTESAYEHDSILGQRKGISTCERDSISEKETSPSEKGKIARNGGNKSASGSDKVTQDHIDDHPPAKQLNVAHVDRVTSTNGTDTQPEFGFGEGREVDGSYACNEKRNSSQSDNNPKTLEIDSAGEKLRMRRKPKEKATEGNEADVAMNREYNHIENGREYCSEDGRTVHAQERSSDQCLANTAEPAVLDRKLKISGRNSPQNNDENQSAEINKNREKRGSNGRGRTLQNIRVNSSNSPMGRNAGKRSRNYSPEGQKMDQCDSYRGTKNRYRYEEQCNVNYSSHDYVDKRRWNPQESERSRDEFVGRRQSPHPYKMHEHVMDRRRVPRSPKYARNLQHSSPPHPRMPEDVNYTTDRNNVHDLKYDEYRPSRHGYDNGRRHTPPFPPRSPDLPPYRRIAEYSTSRSYSFPRHPRSDDVDYQMDQSSFPILHHDQYNTYKYSGYDPAARYSLGYKNDGAHRPYGDVCVDKHTSVHGGPIRDYCRGSEYAHKDGSNWESWTPKASGSVTDKYAPRLDQTNHQTLGQSSVHYDLVPGRWR